MFETKLVLTTKVPSMPEYFVSSYGSGEKNVSHQFQSPRKEKWPKYTTFPFHLMISVLNL